MVGPIHPSTHFITCTTFYEELGSLPSHIRPKRLLITLAILHLLYHRWSQGSVSFDTTCVMAACSASKWIVQLDV